MTSTDYTLHASFQWNAGNKNLKRLSYRSSYYNVNLFFVFAVLLLQSPGAEVLPSVPLQTCVEGQKINAPPSLV